jgi:hypothetical protein
MNRILADCGRSLLTNGNVAVGDVPIRTISSINPPKKPQFDEKSPYNLLPRGIMLKSPVLPMRAGCDQPRSALCRHQTGNFVKFRGQLRGHSLGSGGECDIKGAPTTRAEQHGPSQH